MSDFFNIVVLLLAQERALWRPFRGADWAAAGAVPARCELQREFLATGLRWAGGADKHRERELDAAEDGKLVACTLQGGRRSHVRLTERGEWIAAALAYVSDLGDGYAAVQKVLHFGRPGQLVSELLLVGLRDYTKSCRPRLFDFQCRIAPAIAVGWARSRSDSYGRTAYLVTDRGAAACRPAKPEGLPAPTIRAQDLLWDTYEAERDRLLTLVPEGRDIGELPLAVEGCSAITGLWNFHPQRKNGHG